MRFRLNHYFRMSYACNSPLAPVGRLCTALEQMPMPYNIYRGELQAAWAARPPLPETQFFEQ